MAGVVEYEARWAKVLAFEDEKTALVQDLISRVKSLEANVAESQRLLARERDISDMYQRKVEEKEMQIKEKDGDMRKIQQILAQMDYVLVLIDGDCMGFTDDLVKAGEDGGRQAARQLIISTTEYLCNKYPEVPVSAKIVIRVYANLKGLAKVYRDAQVLSSAVDFGSFVNGFNKENAICDFINAGDGKECADEKIKANFQMGIANAQCRHVFFGGSADNGYARLLGPYRDSKKITLLEGPPFAKELVGLAAKLPTLPCSQVIRDTKLTSAPPATILTPPGTPAKDNPRVTNYAAAASLSTPLSALLIPNEAASASAQGRIALNAAGQRIDMPIACSAASIKAMKSKKYCNEHHILGKCSYKKACKFNHGTRVTGENLEALRAVARLSACPSGLACRAVKCILGHRCLESNCRRGSNCLFGPQLHGIDSVIVKWEG
ncbi:hypothetical protein CC78DRAFT_323231 [Lojkania enalia]|uniref:C3H1-type domain-containing protein n=1 Tax=Lojkania enalia TaxID=147567 RepID=A0A9P4MY88_9PLEO|nr:hypothetical protein CC78DRAFT_323231 [Didymosphaeria enalia]